MPLFRLSLFRYGGLALFPALLLIPPFAAHSITVPARVAQSPSPSPKPTPSPTTSPAPAASPAPKGATPYDRYMLAGYAATKQRQYDLALLHFKRALDERPNDTYATQAIRNVESYRNQPAPATTGSPAPTVVVPPPKPAPASGNPTPKPAPAKPAPAKPAPAKPAPTSTKPAPPKSPTPPTSSQLTPPKAPPAPITAETFPAPPTAVVTIPSAPPSDAFNEAQAIALINRWLSAKAEVFAPPFDLQPVVDLTTGELLASLVRPDGVLTWLKTNRAYFRYGAQRIDSVDRFVIARDRATMEISLTEDRTLYLNGVIDPSRTDFSSQRVRFTFGMDNGVWKIADYKTVNGSLLERSILSAATPLTPAP